MGRSRVVGVVSGRSARLTTIRTARPSQCARDLKRGDEKQGIAEAFADRYSSGAASRLTNL